MLEIIHLAAKIKSSDGDLYAKTSNRWIHNTCNTVLVGITVQFKKASSGAVYYTTTRSLLKNANILRLFVIRI